MVAVKDLVLAVRAFLLGLGSLVGLNAGIGDMPLLVYIVELGSTCVCSPLVGLQVLS